MATLSMDFYADWVAYLRGELAAVGYPPPAAVDGQEVCFRYFNYRKRVVDIRPRAVAMSEEFAVLAGQEAGYAALKAKIEAGEDLRPHLSRSLTNPDYDDPMLNDWGIHHFHLGTVMEADGFVARTGPLLYARVLNDKILCLQIMAHANWTNQQLIEILHKNWPQVLVQYRLKGVSAAVPPPTDEELKKLRRGRVNTLLQLADGTLIAPPGGGIATSGLSAQVVRDCDWYAHQMKAIEKHVLDSFDKIAAVAQAEGIALPEACVFRLHVHDGKFVAVEVSTNWGFVPPQ